MVDKDIQEVIREAAIDVMNRRGHDLCLELAKKYDIDLPPQVQLAVKAAFCSGLEYGMMFWHIVGEESEKL